MRWGNYVCIRKPEHSNAKKIKNVSSWHASNSPATYSALQMCLDWLIDVFSSCGRLRTQCRCICFIPFAVSRGTDWSAWHLATVARIWWTSIAPSCRPVSWKHLHQVNHPRFPSNVVLYGDVEISYYQFFGMGKNFWPVRTLTAAITKGSLRRPVRVKKSVPYSYWSLGGVLISLPKAVSP